MPPDPVSLPVIAVAVALVSAAGALVPLWRDPGDRVRCYMLHAAGGILLAVVAVELWPEVAALDSPTHKFGGLLLGAVAMVGLNLLTRHLSERGEGGGTPWGLVVASLMDAVVDGALIGVAYATDQTTGLLLGIGIGIERFTMTMVVATELRADGCRGGRLAALVGLTTLPLAPAAALGALLLADASAGANALILAGAAAALIYLIVAEMLARGRDARDSVAAVAIFFAGFIALAVAETLMPA